MGRKRAFSWRKRFAALLLLVLLGAGGWLWWQGQHWAPPRGPFPQQGALVGARDGEADFKALKAIGADFVYLEASSGAAGHGVTAHRPGGGARGQRSRSRSSSARSAASPVAGVSARAVSSPRA